MQQQPVPTCDEKIVQAIIEYWNLHNHSRYDKAAKEKCKICNPKKTKTRK